MIKEAKLSYNVSNKYACHSPGYLTCLYNFWMAHNQKVCYVK